MVLELDRRRRSVLTDLEHGGATRSGPIHAQSVRSTDKAERDLLIARTRAASEALKPMDDEIADVTGQLDAALLELPNTPHPSVPGGGDSSGNVLVSSGGQMPEFEFKPLKITSSWPKIWA